tara:strand:+ start:2652 stop:5912 length:3261 start_codon:yes stop_codon:yes gene_type:complete
MGNVTNTFVKSKMNKDLDDRLLSNGEYRNAKNVNISRSEGEDVGALENVLGNQSISTFQGYGCDIIGFYEDDTNQCVYSFLTNWTDPSSDQLSTFATEASDCFILKTYLSGTLNGTTEVLVAGRFLNFSKTHHIYGVNLIEDLLFWTDDRNQPRKINVKLARSIISGTTPSYYINEDQISVAKYYPYKVPSLYESVTITLGSQAPAASGFNIVEAPTADVAKLRAGDILNIPYQKIPPVSSNLNGSNFIEYPIQIAEIDYSPDSAGDSSFVTNLYAKGTVVDPTGGIGGKTIEFLRPSSKRVTDRFLPENNSAAFVSQVDTGAPNGWLVTLKRFRSPYNPLGGGSLITNVTNQAEVYVVTNQDTFNNNESVIGVSAQLEGVTSGDIIGFKQPNPMYVDSWPGDKEFLRDKFVRFAYRFKFDDGEYSLISPFTQPAFIPKQDGYVNTIAVPPVITTSGTPTTTLDDIKNIQKSTIVAFFENKVQDVTIKIDMPYNVDGLERFLNVQEIDILYKASDDTRIQVLETIETTSDQIVTNSTKVLKYKYQSRNPYKTLPPSEVTRVFDKVPVRAKTQSITGNRVMYGNFLDKHTPPENLNYNVLVSEKYRPTNTNTTYSTISYPNHTLKQNRTYQVGVVLADRYGRQSDVILSSVTDFQFEQTGGTEVFNGSTVFSPFKNDSASWVDTWVSSGSTGDPGNTGDGIINGDTANPISWFGDSLKMLFRDKIPETVTYADGYPGLYNSGVYELIPNSNGFSDPGIEFNGKVDPRISIGDIIVTNSTNNPASPLINSSIIDISYSSTSNITSFEVDDISAMNYFLGVPVYVYGQANLLGWYSYKIVVKQVKQEYYNAYLPLIVNNVPGTTGDGAGANGSISQAYTTLISDNINKIPSDLQEVQPEQTQFRTSDVLLYPRVLTSNFAIQGNASTTATDINFYYQFPMYFQSRTPNEYLTVDTIGKVTDLGINTNNEPGNVGTPSTITTAPGIYDAKSNPTVARLSTYGEDIGYISLTSRNNEPNNLSNPDFPELQDLYGAISILEVDPEPSRLAGEIFWETATCGLISDLNTAIETGTAADPIPPTPPQSTIAPIR